MESRGLKFLLAGLFVFALLSSNAQAATPLISPYLCGIGNNQTCIAYTPTLLNATENFSSWSMLYRQYSINGTSNKTDIYFANSTGFRKLVLANAFSSVFTEANSLEHRFAAFYSADDKKAYFIFNPRDSDTCFNSCSVNAAYLYSYDLQSASTALIATYTIGSGNAGGHSFNFGKVGIGDYNSTLFVISWSAAEIGNPFNTAGATQSYKKAGGFGPSFPITGQLAIFADGTDAVILSGDSASISQTTFYINGTQKSAGVILSNSGTNRLGNQYASQRLVFWTNKDGNYEVYDVENFAGTITRLTATGANEKWVSSRRIADGTVLVGYLSDDTNTTYGDSFCGSDITPTFGTNCSAPSFTGVCSQCYVSNGTQCIAVQGCTIPQPPTLGFYAEGIGCSNNQLFQNGIGWPIKNVRGRCNSNLGDVTTTQLWVYADYGINGQVALPSSLNSSTGAVCSVCLSDGITNCHSMSYSDPASFGGTNWRWSYLASSIDVFGNSTGSFTPYLINSYLNGTRFPVGDILKVICNSNLPNTAINGIIANANSVTGGRLDTADFNGATLSSK
jgi:hypothetical protein